MSSDPIATARRGAGSGIAFVVTGPSGAGKTSVIEEVMKRYPELRLSFSVSHTTRAIRECETDGADYVFVSEDEFRALVDKDSFIEHAVYSGFHYGTSEQQLKAAFAGGHDVLLNVEVQGAESIRKRGLGDHPVVLVFLTTSTVERLEDRLRRRGTDTEEKIAERIRMASTELACLSDFDYLVINDDLEQAVTELQAIIQAEQLRLRTGCA